MSVVKYICPKRIDGEKMRRLVIFLAILYFILALAGYVFHDFEWSIGLSILYFGYPLIWILWFIYFLGNSYKTLKEHLLVILAWVLLDSSFLLLINATSIPGADIRSSGADALFVLGYGIFMVPLLLFPGVDGLLDGVAAWFGVGSFEGAWFVFSLLGLAQTFLVLILHRLFLMITRLRVSGK